MISPSGGGAGDAEVEPPVRAADTEEQADKLKAAPPRAATADEPINVRRDTFLSFMQSLYSMNMIRRRTCEGTDDNPFDARLHYSGTTPTMSIVTSLPSLPTPLTGISEEVGGRSGS